MEKYFNQRAVPFGIWKGDSLNLIIPPDKWRLTQKAIDDNVFGYIEEISKTNTSTGDTTTEEQEKNDNFQRWKSDKTKASFQYKILKGHLIGIEDGSLHLKLNSKNLKSMYFYGITAETLPLLYRNLINEGYIEIDYIDFIQAEGLQDVDIACDFIVDDVNELNHIGKALTKPSKANDVVLRNNKTECSVAWSTRQKSKSSKAYKTGVYLKFYAKPLELETNSIDFYNEHLKPVLAAGAVSLFDEVSVGLPTNMVRVEFNMRKPKAFEVWGCGKIKSLQALVTFLGNQERVMQLYIGVRDSYIKPKLILKDPNKIPPSSEFYDLLLENTVKENSFTGTGKYMRAANYLIDSRYGFRLTPSEKSRKRNAFKPLKKMALALDQNHDKGKQLELDIYDQAKQIGILP